MVTFPSIVGVTAVVELGVVVVDDPCEEVDADVAIVVKLASDVEEELAGVVEFETMVVAGLSDDVILPIKNTNLNIFMHRLGKTLCLKIPSVICQT